MFNTEWKSKKRLKKENKELRTSFEIASMWLASIIQSIGLEKMLNMSVDNMISLVTSMYEKAGAENPEDLAYTAVMDARAEIVRKYNENGQ